MTLVEVGRQTPQPPAGSDAAAADDEADDVVSCAAAAGTQIRTDPEWRPPSLHREPRTSCYPSAVRDAIRRRGGRSSRPPPSTSPSPPACPSPAAPAPPPRSRRRRSRMQTRPTTHADQQVLARRRLALARRSTATPGPDRTSPRR